MFLAALTTSLLFAAAPPQTTPTTTSTAASEKGFVPRQTLAPQGEKRIALVIGNASYDKGPLKNPTRDAKAMADTLASVGFDVDAQFDLDRRGMLRALRRFAERLDKDSVALFYYSGHGLTVNGRSFMLPVGTDIRTTADVELEAVDLRRVTARLEEVGSRLNLVILDACRNNPLIHASRRDGSGGLAFLTAPTGTLIAYATAPGQTALDGGGELSPYTKALVQELKVPGRPVEEVFKSVRRRVRKASRGGQVPWESSSLEGRFVFVPEGWTPEPIAPDEAQARASVEDDRARRAKRKKRKPRRPVAALRRPQPDAPSLAQRIEAAEAEAVGPSGAALMLRHASLERRIAPASKMLLGSGVVTGALVATTVGGVGGAFAIAGNAGTSGLTEAAGVASAGCYLLAICAGATFLPSVLLTTVLGLYTLNLVSNRRIVESKLKEKGLKPRPATAMRF